jgi:hypothetical protein
VTHYVLAWTTAAPVTLAATDLFPAPPTDTALATRAHVFAPAGAPQQAGCVNGAPAQPGCVAVLPPGVLPTIAPTGTAPSNFSLTAVYTPLANGAYFLGELAAVVHVSPQRFAYVGVGGAGPAGVVAGVWGTGGSVVTLTAVTPDGTVSASAVTLPPAGFAEVQL